MKNARRSESRNNEKVSGFLGLPWVFLFAFGWFFLPLKAL